MKKDSSKLLDRGRSQTGRPPILEGKFFKSKSPFLGCSAKPNWTGSFLLADEDEDSRKLKDGIIFIII